jgi:hypothetical protein
VVINCLFGANRKLPEPLLYRFHGNGARFAGINILFGADRSEIVIERAKTGQNGRGVPSENSLHIAFAGTWNERFGDEPITYDSQISLVLPTSGYRFHVLIIRRHEEFEDCFQPGP